MDPNTNPNSCTAAELQRYMRRVTYEHYDKPLLCKGCRKQLVEEKARAGYRIFRKCCVGNTDPMNVYIAWMNPEEAAALEVAYSGALGTTNELNFINQYAEIEVDDE